jgi:hypothetical protein
MLAEVVTADLLRGLAMIGAKDDEAVELALPAGMAELTAWRGCWETVAWEVESDADGPTATVHAGELRAAADHPMITAIAALDGGGLRVGDAYLLSLPDLAPQPRLVSMLGGVDLTLPASSTNPYAAVLADIDGGGAKVWIRSPLLQRLRLRQITRVRLFPELGSWYLSGLAVDETHLMRVTGRVYVY